PTIFQMAEVYGVLPKTNGDRQQILIIPVIMALSGELGNQVLYKTLMAGLTAEVSKKVGTEVIAEAGEKETLNLVSRLIKQGIAKLMASKNPGLRFMGNWL